jgi:hypothetical protein
MSKELKQLFPQEPEYEKLYNGMRSHYVRLKDAVQIVTDMYAGRDIDEIDNLKTVFETVKAGD